MFRLTVLAILLVVVLVTAWVAGRQAGPPDDTGTDATRLGPAAGESVTGYLARTRAVRPGPGQRLALVQLDAPLDAAAALGAVPTATPVQVVFRVPLPRVQTAVRRIPLPAGAGGVADVLAAQTQASADADRQASDTRGRVAAVARVEASALQAHCACVLALVVRIDPAHPPAVVPPIRALEVAPVGARERALAVSPLLPEQTDVVGPVPDDGPVAPSGPAASSGLRPSGPVPSSGPVSPPRPAPAGG